VLVPALAYAALVADLVGSGLLAPHVYGRGPGAETITRMTAVTFGYVLLAGPRMMAPRRQLVRLLSGLAPGRLATALTALGVLALTAATGWAAWTLVPHWYPIAAPYASVHRLLNMLPGRS
jgi:hypothetical protein